MAQMSGEARPVGEGAGVRNDAPGHSAGAQYASSGTPGHSAPGHSAALPTPFPGTEYVDPAQVFAGPGYTSPPEPTHRLASVALILATLGVVIAPLLVISLILAALALLPAVDREGVGAHTALAALVVSLAGVGAWALFLVQILGR